jgi:hypothetical protein
VWLWIISVTSDFARPSRASCASGRFSGLSDRTRPKLPSPSAFCGVFRRKPCVDQHRFLRIGLDHIATDADLARPGMNLEQAIVQNGKAQGLSLQQVLRFHAVAPILGQGGFALKSGGGGA